MAADLGNGKTYEQAKRLTDTPRRRRYTQRHRREISRAMDRVRALLGELEALTPSPAANDSATSGRDIRLEHFLSLPLRASIIKELSIALHELITLERQSYGMDAPRVVVMPAKAAKDGAG